MNNLKNTVTRIIILDDNHTFRNVLKEYLTKELQYDIIGEASNSEDFFKLNNLHQADVILMDLQMPNMDGYQVTKKLLIQYNWMKVIAITMYTDKTFLEELVVVGFKGCVFKPDIFEKIEPAIKKVLSNELFFPNEIVLSKNQK